MSGVSETRHARIRRLFTKILNGQVFAILFPGFSFYILQKRYQRYLKNLAVAKLPFVVRMEYGGLGDQIVWSGVPEAILKTYGVRTEISLQSPFRSEEIKNFVWGGNPYVSFSAEPGILITLPHVKKYPDYNQLLFGLFGLAGPLFSLPYHPLPRPDVSDKIVCDLSLGPSHVYNESGTRDFWDAVVRYLTDHFPKETILLVEPTSPYPDKRLTHYIKEKLGVPVISVDSIEHLTDVLCSAKERVLLDSGSKSIAAAYGKHSFVLVRGFVNGYFKYPTNDYIIL